MSCDVENLELEERAGARKTHWGPMLTIPGFHSPRLTSPGPIASQWKARENDEVDSPSITDAELRCRDSLISLMVGDKVVKGSLIDSCTWYTTFLETKYRSNWQMLCSALKGLPNNAMAPQTGELTIVYQFVIAVAKLLKTKRNLALVEIVDHLDNNDIIKTQLDDQRAIPNQMVFATIGWLTMLYEAQSHPDPDKLQVTKTSTSSFGYRNTLSTRKFSTYSQSFQYIDVPLYNLLNRFGDLIPELGATPMRELGLGLGHISEFINPQQVCWDTLQNVAELRIEWVTALSLHLEFDSGKRTLKLFRYPSYARMMCCDRKNNLLSQLLNNHVSSISGDVNVPDVPTEEFFQEILLSYRVIFGQDTRSWKAFSRMIPLEEQSGMSACEASWSCDPMLAILCGKSSISPAARRIYDEIDACEIANSYDPATDFQFFGRRILELQSFVKQHQPRTLRGLWSDRRDAKAWWTLWGNQVLIFVASITILLVILQLVFQVWQVLLAQQQIDLAQKQLQMGPSRKELLRY